MQSTASSTASSTAYRPAIAPKIPNFPKRYEAHLLAEMKNPRLTGKYFTLTVGKAPNTKTFTTTHAGVLSKSEVFKKMCDPDGDFREPITMTIEFPDDSIVNFEWMLAYFYDSTIPPIKVPHTLKGYRQLTDLYAMGDKYMASDFKNFIVTSMKRELRHSRRQVDIFEASYHIYRYTSARPTDDSFYVWREHFIFEAQLLFLWLTDENHEHVKALATRCGGVFAEDLYDAQARQIRFLKMTQWRHEDWYEETMVRKGDDCCNGRCIARERVDRIRKKVAMMEGRLRVFPRRTAVSSSDGRSTLGAVHRRVPEDPAYSGAVFELWKATHG